MDDWNTIDTIPKEHAVQILVCEAGKDMAVVKWLDASIVGDEFFQSGFYLSDGMLEPILYQSMVYCTHWKRLPKMPEKE